MESADFNHLLEHPELLNAEYIDGLKGIDRRISFFSGGLDSLFEKS